MPRPDVLVTLPGKQSRHTLERMLPGIGLAVPASHAMHELLSEAPVFGLYVPAGLQADWMHTGGM